MAQQQLQHNDSNDLVTLHPQAIDYLFCFKRQLHTIFRDIIGLHEIDHVALYFIDNKEQLIAFSSHPAIEYTLFDSLLWQYDGIFSNAFKQQHWAWWPQLYHQHRSTDLTKVKQSRHQLEHGLSINKSHPDYRLIYSFATRANEQNQAWQNNIEELSQIGDYCHQQLQPLITTL